MSRVLVSKLVDYYWNVKDTRDTMALIGRVGSDELTMMDDLLIDLDKILRNISKPWAKGYRTRGHRIPIRFAREDDEDNTVQVTVHTL